MPLRLLKYPGGKTYLARWIISELPKNYETMHFSEIFCGGCNVTLQKKPSISEHLNDINCCLYWLLYYVKYHGKLFSEMIENVEYTKENFELALKDKETCYGVQRTIQQSVWYFVRLRFSRGALERDWAWSNRFRGGRFGEVNAWENIKKELPKVSKRLENVNLTMFDFRIAIVSLNYDNVLLYADPPYFGPHRTTKNLFQQEVTLDDHKDFADLCNNSKAKILISAYPSLEYLKWFSNWNLIWKNVPNNMAQTKHKSRKFELLFRNY